MYKFKVIEFNIEGVQPNYIALHPITADELDLSPGMLLIAEKSNYGFRLITTGSMSQGMAGISTERITDSNIRDGDEYEFYLSGSEGVTGIIRKKMGKNPLKKSEIERFFDALEFGMLTPAHVAAFGVAVEINGMQSDEIVSVAGAFLKNSKKFTPKGNIIVDKHSIGGIAGNRITPLMVPIISAAGLVIPKVSTRAITSPAGTVDTLEVVINTDLSFEEASVVLNKTGGCMVNGETVGLGSTADKFLSAVEQVKIDPRELMIASILAKKKAAGASTVLIDLPTGKGSKLPTREEARKLAYDFSKVGNKLGFRVESVISPGDKPIGSHIGPALEMQEVLGILEHKRGDLSLIRKALSLSGLLFESVHVANRGEGYAMANEILESGKAYQQFLNIAEAQGHNDNLSADKIENAPYSYTIKAEHLDIVYAIDNYNVGSMARAAGAPLDKTAGVILHVDRGDHLAKGDPIIEIRAHSESKLDEAIEMMRTSPPIILERSVLEHITGVQE